MNQTLPERKKEIKSTLPAQFKKPSTLGWSIYQKLTHVNRAHCEISGF
jgi:hypothetical protein